MAEQGVLLNYYVFDYLRRRGLRAAATQFAQEANIDVAWIDNGGQAEGQLPGSTDRLWQAPHDAGGASRHLSALGRKLNLAGLVEPGSQPFLQEWFTSLWRTVATCHDAPVPSALRPAPTLAPPPPTRRIAAQEPLEAQPPAGTTTVPAAGSQLYPGNHPPFPAGEKAPRDPAPSSARKRNSSVVSTTDDRLQSPTPTEDTGPKGKKRKGKKDPPPPVKAAPDVSAPHSAAATPMLLSHHLDPQRTGAPVAGPPTYPPGNLGLQSYLLAQSQQNPHVAHPAFLFPGPSPKVPASTIPTPSATPVTIVHQSSPQPPVSTIAPGDNPAGASPLTSGFPTTQEQMRQEHLKMQQLVLQTRVNAQQQLAEHRHTMAQRGQPPPKPPPASTSRVKKSSAAPTFRRSASTSKANPAPSTPLTASAPATSISLRVHSAPEEPSTVTSASAAPDSLVPFALTDFNFDELLDPHGPRISMDAMIGNLGTCGDQYGHLPDRGLLEDLDPAVLSRLMQDPGSGLDFFNHQFFTDDPAAPSSSGQDG